MFAGDLDVTSLWGSFPPVARRITSIAPTPKKLYNFPMDNCCGAKANELKNLSVRQGRILWIVLGINLAMFFIEGAFGLMARSTALLADSLDMAGDAFVYGISLYAIGRSVKWNASVSLVKGIVMTIFGVSVLVQAILRYQAGEPPVAELMGWVGALALAANFTCAALLLRHRNDDLNMRSTWLCSRNDVIANLGVIGAAFAVGFSGSLWPDLVVGAAIAALVLRSAVQVLRESVEQLKA